MQSTTEAGPNPDLTVPTAAGNSERLYFPVLESFRGWAILFVVLFHIKGFLYGDVALGEQYSWVWSWAYVGNTGVTLFFVLSGFLLSLPFLIGLQRGTIPSLKAFYAARAIRILPLYYLAVLVAWIHTHDTANSIRCLFFLPVGYAMHPHSLPWWSLGTEVQFYALLPVAMALAGSRRGRWIVAAALMLWLAVYVRFYRLEWWIESVDAAATWRETLFGRAPNFLAGVFAAWLYSRANSARLLKAPKARFGIAMVAFVTLCGLISSVARSGTGPAELAHPQWHVLEGIAWAALLISSLHGGGGRVAMVWDNAAMRKLGRISYGLFLFHLPVLWLFLAQWSDRADKSARLLVDSTLIVRVAIGFVTCLLVANVLHRTVEEPCQRLRRRGLAR